MIKRNPAFVLGMFETGLAVGRSLGRKGINVIGIDFKKDIAFYSRYIRGQLCSHPIEEEQEFVDFLIALARSQEHKPVLFVTSDDFFPAIVHNRAEIEKCFLANLPDNDVIQSVADKYQQYKLATRVGISCPTTYTLENSDDIRKLKASLPYPVFVKARDVNEWRKYVSNSTKGYVVNDERDMTLQFAPLIKRGLKVIVQEIVDGPDTNHYKTCCYVSKEGEFILIFTLQKLRQQPVKFGVGCLVRSINYPELAKVGRKLFSGIGYHGVGSAEFKLDEKDGNLKLIELNPRYWQQNSLSERCGMNFPVIDYMEVTGQNPHPMHEFRSNVKWVNMYMDLSSFLEYRRKKEITFGAWVNSIKDVRVLSDFARDDPLPMLYESRFGMKTLKIPRYLIDRYRNGRD